jgi:hypothetical protein
MRCAGAGSLRTCADKFPAQANIHAAPTRTLNSRAMNTKKAYIAPANW